MMQNQHNNMNKDLLIEYSIFTPTKRRLSEGTANGNGNMIVSGLVQACDKPNANRRIYPYDTLKSQVELYIKGPIAENRALGELDHPETSVINLKNVSHNILKLWWDGKNLFGDIEILPTPSGNILRQLFANNITVGISSRAMGTVSPIGEGLVQVEDDLELICWDFVSTPSTYGAYVRPVSGLNESYNLQQETNKYQRSNRLVSDIICSLSGVCCIN
jgi:hypothetical protein